MRRASFWIKFPTVGSESPVTCPEYAQGGRSVDWVVLEVTGT